jgi:hypothetical protein
MQRVPASRDVIMAECSSPLTGPASSRAFRNQAPPLALFPPRPARREHAVPLHTRHAEDVRIRVCDDHGKAPLVVHSLQPSALLRALVRRVDTLITWLSGSEACENPNSVSHLNPAEPIILEAIPGGLWFGAWGPINVVIWAGPATADVVTRINRGLAVRYDALDRTLMSTVHVVLTDVRPPDPDARVALVDMNERWRHAVACGAVVIEHVGLAGVALRSAITGIIILAPKHYRVKVFDALEPCATWVAEQHSRVTSVPVEAAQLLQCLHHAHRAATS